MDELKLARRLIKKYNTNDPFEICDFLNYIVVKTPLTGVRGFYQYFERTNIIYISDNLNYHVEKFVCAHELGHSLMHKKANEIFLDTRTFLKTSIYERQADRFAIDLSFPDDDFFNDYKDFTTSQLARCLGASEKLIEYRIDMIKNMPPEQGRL